MSGLLPELPRRLFPQASTVVLLLLAAGTNPAAGIQSQAEDESILSIEGTDGREYSVEEIGTRCVEFGPMPPGPEGTKYRECRVSEHGEMGAANGQRYFYATYCLMPSDAEKGSACGDGSFHALFNSHRGQAIFVKELPSERAKVLFRLIGTGPGAVTFGRKPFISSGSSNTVMVLPVAQDGTANTNRSAYFVLNRGRWDRIEGRSWEESLLKRLPDGFDIRRGIWPDLRSMTATVHLYQVGDVDCCPSGGVARVKLRVAAARLEMVGVTFEPAKE